MNDRYLEIWNLNKTYDTPKGPAVIVQDFRLNIREGEFIALIGHSGCGKSTVLSMIAGLTEKTSGAICLAKHEIDEPSTDRGVVFQAPCLLPWMTAMANVTLGIEQALPKSTEAERNTIAAYYLELVGLKDAMHKKPAELSQGMQQRVGIARAFALQPKVLLLDEPFGMLDSLTRLELQEVLAEVWRTDRKTALMVTHDVDEAIFLSDRIAMMTSGPGATLGEIVEVPFPHPRPRTLFEDPAYDVLKDRVIDFLESQSHNPKAPALAAAV